MDQKLIDSLAGIIDDYRPGAVEQPSAARIQKWAQQFGQAVREPMLEELTHVLGQTYIRKTHVQSFLAALVVNEKLTGGNPKASWQGAKLLNIQRRGASQREMLAMFGTQLEGQLNLNIADCGKNTSSYVYVDDGLFTGNHILNDLKDWLASDAPVEALVHVIVIALHRGGQYYARSKLEEVAKEKGKKINFTWWKIVELEDRRSNINTSDVLRPTRIPDDADTKSYVAAMQHTPALREPGNMGDLKLFSSEQARDLLEQEFLVKGIYIRKICPHLNEFQRPLGNMLLETLGFGSTIVTFRNCPNNAPLVFWAGRPWYPLFPRKTN